MLDPAQLKYVVLLHFEGDECGGMDRFMAEARGAELVGSDMSAVLNLTAFGVDYVDRVRGVRDGEKIELGEHTLSFLETPHVHHWDSMMVFEESTRSLFPSDLFIQTGDQPPVVNEDLTDDMCAFYREIGIFAHEEPVRRTIDRLEPLAPEYVHAMHGGSLTGEIFPRYVQRAARAAVRVPGQVARAADRRAGRRLAADRLLERGSPAGQDRRAVRHEQHLHPQVEQPEEGRACACVLLPADP